MKKLTYAEQLKNPLWQRKRLEMLESAKWECQNCGSIEKTLHVHHRQYIKGRMAWEYSDEQLSVLCEDCHTEEHLLEGELKELLAVVSTMEALAILKGFYSQADWFDWKIGDAGRDRDPNAHAVGFVASLLGCLSPEKLQSVAEFAVSLSSPNSEERLILPKNLNIFEECL